MKKPLPVRREVNPQDASIVAEIRGGKEHKGQYILLPGTSDLDHLNWIPHGTEFWGKAKKLSPSGIATPDPEDESQLLYYEGGFKIPPKFSRIRVYNVLDCKDELEYEEANKGWFRKLMGGLDQYDVPREVLRQNLSWLEKIEQTLVFRGTLYEPLAEKMQI